MKMVYKRESGLVLGAEPSLTKLSNWRVPSPRVKTSTDEVPWTVLQIPVFRMNLIDYLKQKKIGPPVTRPVEIHHSGE